MLCVDDVILLAKTRQIFFSMLKVWSKQTSYFSNPSKCLQVLVLVRISLADFANHLSVFFASNIAAIVAKRRLLMITT